MRARMMPGSVASPVALSRVNAGTPGHETGGATGGVLWFVNTGQPARPLGGLNVVGRGGVGTGWRLPVEAVLIVTLTVNPRRLSNNNRMIDRLTISKPRALADEDPSGRRQPSGEVLGLGQSARMHDRAVDHDPRC